MKFKQHNLVLIIKRNASINVSVIRFQRNAVEKIKSGSPILYLWLEMLQLCSRRAAQDWSMGAFPQGC